MSILIVTVMQNIKAIDMAMAIMQHMVL